MKINVESIAETAFEVLAETGLDGLSMRLVATRLEVQTSALYWHVKNKQQLLDVLANTIFAAAAQGLEAPRVGVGWQEWLGDWARRLRRAMLAHRDGARVFAGSNITEPAVFRATELALRTLQDAGFPVRRAARGVAALLHYAVGFTIEEQFHLGVGETEPHRVDSTRFPLTAQAYVDDQLYDADTDGCFEYGLTVILAGMRITNED